MRKYLGLIILFNFMFVCYLFVLDLRVYSFFRTSFTTQMSKEVFNGKPATLSHPIKLKIENTLAICLFSKDEFLNKHTLLNILHHEDKKQLFSLSYDALLFSWVP